MRHDNACSCPSPRHCCTCLSHIVSDSVVYASVSVSFSRSCPLTFSWVSFLWRASWIDPSVVRSCHTPICFPAHVPHIARLPEVALASAPVPICSKIWVVCFDVNTVLDDPPINSGGATRTRHDDAISGKRLTVPCGSDFLFVSVIRDGLASQHARLPCSPTVLNTVSLVRSSAARGVF